MGKLPLIGSGNETVRFAGYLLYGLVFFGLISFLIWFSWVRVPRKGVVEKVVDGDTIVVGGKTIRLVGVDTPEEGEDGFLEAKNFVEGWVLGKEVVLDVDDERPRDQYGRVLAVVYVDGANLNAELLQRGYAEILYLPPSEFNPYKWISS